jgi:AraC family transcriptional regulator
MSVSPRFSSCSIDYYCPSGAASRAGNEANSHRCSALFSLIDLRPADIFRRQTAAWCGLGGELTHTLRREPFEVGYSGAWHLLIAYESAQRSDGETIIDGLPRSTLRDLSRKLVFVPAGLGFREWQEPRSLMSAIYLHLDPATALMRDEERSRSPACAPRLFFESTALWQTALKLKGLIETSPTASPSMRKRSPSCCYTNSSRAADYRRPERMAVWPIRSGGPCSSTSRSILSTKYPSRRWHR